jgi:hypothetical protein
MKPSQRFLAVLTLSTVLGYACGSDSPTGSSISAPTIQSPAMGATVPNNTPTLTVGNSTGGTGEPTYRFEVATDSSFANRIASVEGVGQGSGGSTSWRVPEPLRGGTVDDTGFATYYWRAQASATGEVSPWSATANMKVQEGVFLDEPSPSGLIVSDPLTNGTSVGEGEGGEFRPGGWMATNASVYIRYDIPTLRSGYVQFDVTNLREPNPRSDKRMLMNMWDPTRGEYTTNPFRVHLQKMDRRTVNFDHLRLRWISQGQERNVGYNFFNWDPNKIYRFRMEWGDFPGIDSQRVRVLMDDQEILTRNYDPPYIPATHWVELGCAPRNETLEEAIFSNVMIGTR